MPRGTLGRPHARVKGACRTARGSLRHQRCASAGLPYAECVPARCLEFALTGSRHRLCPGRTLSVRASAAAARGPSRRTAWAIASRDEGGGVRPRALDELLVGVGQGVCIRTILPSCKEGIRHDTHKAPTASIRARSRRGWRRCKWHAWEGTDSRLWGPGHAWSSSEFRVFFSLNAHRTCSSCP